MNDMNDVETRLLRCKHCGLEREFRCYERGEQFFTEHAQTHHPEVFAKADVRRQREIATCERMLTGGAQAGRSRTT